MTAARPVTHKLTVRGVFVQTTTRHRYLVVDVRPEDVVGDGRRYVKFADVIGRTDDLSRARKRADVPCTRGVVRVIIDTTTGEEV